MRSSVLDQMFAQFKTSATLWAHVRSRFRVHHVMVSELALVDERLTALRTNVSRHAHVPFNVKVKAVNARIAVGAQMARVPFHSHVAIDVLLQRRTLTKALAAQVADQRFLAGVDTPMVLHVAAARKAAFANVARELFDAVVHAAPVRAQVRPGAELLAARFARERFLASVQAQMILEFAAPVAARERAPVAFQVLALVRHQRVLRQLLVASQVVIA